MNIVVLNGSPKGKTSVTMQYVQYLEKCFSAHHFSYFPISQQISKLEKDAAAFQSVMDAVAAGDLVFWATPVYYLLVPAQYKRFIELIDERQAREAFAGKYAVVLTTSLHYLDNTAHSYLRSITEDLDMRFAGAYSADMFDLPKPSEQERLRLFAADVFETALHKASVTRACAPLTPPALVYQPGPVRQPVFTKGKKILIITTACQHDSNLAAMVKHCKDALNGRVEVVDLNSLDIRGGCLGCIQCCMDNVCAYEGKDGYVDFYREKVIPADIIVFAGEIVDRYLSWQFKQYFDRSFFMNHTPTLGGKQIAYLISGPLSQIPNLRDVFEFYTRHQHANLVDMISDEYASSAELDALIERLADRIIAQADRGYLAPPTFPVIGGAKIFRDEVWGQLRFIFQADHRYYKEHGFYNFPQRNYRTRVLNAIMIPLTKLPFVRKELLKRMKTEMIRPLRKVVARAGFI